MASKKIPYFVTILTQIKLWLYFANVEECDYVCRELINANILNGLMNQFVQEE